MDTSIPRQQLVACMRELLACGLTQGTSGNASLRCGDAMLITPSGIAPALLQPSEIVLMSLDAGTAPRGQTPSSEWQMHAALYRERPDAQAIVHCHSRHATALACCGRDIPAFHYMVAVAGGDCIRCAPYACFGSTELARNAGAALRERKACLLANHGQLSLGSNLGDALALAVEVEELAAQYCIALGAGGPQLLGEQAMSEVLRKFADYRLQR